MVDARLTQFSSALFENAYVLPVSAAIAQLSDGQFTQRRLAAALNVSDNLVKPVLTRLRAAELVKDAGRVSGRGGGQLVQRLPSAYWVWVEAICAELLGDDLGDLSSVKD